MDKTKPIVKCPTCKKDVVWDKDSLYRPFCSERCKLIDLGAWLDGTMKIEETLENSNDEAIASMPKFIKNYVQTRNQDQEQ